MKKVCVIGAGASGLSTLIALSEHEEEVEVVCYERTNSVGGQWKLDWRTGVDAFGEPVTSSMYD